MNASVRNLALIAATMGVDMPDLWYGGAEDGAKVKGPPNNGIRLDGTIITDRYVRCTHCGAEPIRRFWKMDASTGSLKRVFEQPLAGGKITLHTCPIEPRDAMSRANSPAKKEHDRFESDFAVSRADRRRKYNENRKAAKAAA